MSFLCGAFERLPGLKEAVTGQDGGRPLGRVRGVVLARVASGKSVGAWIEWARSHTVRQLVEAVQWARRSASVWPPEPVGFGNALRLEQAEGGGLGGLFEDPEQEAEETGVLVRLVVPEPVRVAFEEGLELHRAIEGGQATVTSFVEALVGEAASGGPLPFDAERVGLGRAAATKVVEEALARSTGGWAGLSWSAPGGGELDRVSRILGRLRALERRAGVGGAADLLEQLREAVALEDEIERAFGRLLAEMGDMRAWQRLRFSGVGHYGQERLGLPRRTAEARAALARAVRSHPVLREAYEGGRIGAEAAGLLLRVLKRAGAGRPEEKLEEAWVRRAEEVTIKRLRDEVRAVGLGRFVGGKDGRTRLTPTPLPDEAWYSSIERRAGLARRRVALLGSLAALGQSADVFLRLRLPERLASELLASIEAARAELSRQAEQMPWWEEGPAESPPPGSVRAARSFSSRCLRSPAWVGLLALLERYVEVWDDARAQPERRHESLYSRAGWRCEAPACTARRNLELHHIVYRSRGGSDDPTNLLCLCRFHHGLGEHGELASCRGTAPLGVVWRLGRADCARWYFNERRLGPDPPLGILA